MADAVVIPGGMFGPAAGMLMYGGDVAGYRGATVHRHTWSRPPAVPPGPESEDWVRAELGPLLDGTGGRPLLIGKSYGTIAATIAAERSLPAVWLTPLLTVPWVAAALARATAPLLLIGGTADPMWDGALARRLSPHVLEVAGANHGMEVPGPVTATIAVLGRMVAAMEQFLDAIAWP
jgi:hypothetical protein